MYSQLAKHYDALMIDVDYAGWLKRVNNILKKHKCKKGADLATGTGNFCIGLKSLGYDVFGVDKSEEMLLEAAKKAKQRGLNLTFVKQDINRFLYRGSLDFITCMCDGVNYLKNPKLLFERVKNTLKKGGVFIFDVSSEYKLINTVADRFFCIDNDKLTVVWQNRLSKNKDRIFMDLTFFEKSLNVYHRSDESQIQYIHKTEDLLALLMQDFVVSVKKGNATQRIHFVAVKK